MRRRVALVAALLLVAACGGDDRDSASTTSTVAAGPESGPRTFSGMARLDGVVVDTDFLGAVVRRDGLITPCQAELPAVARGRYEIDVLADPDALGCGQPGAEVLLWIYVGEQKVFTTQAIPWPAGGTTTVDVEFTSDAPLGAATPITELHGVVFKQGIRMPVGTRVEALIGNTVCAVASVQESGDFVGYILNIVGSDAIPGCDTDATVSFRVDGEPVVQTIVNSPERSGELDLTDA